MLCAFRRNYSVHSVLVHKKREKNGKGNGQSGRTDTGDP